jgi:hypothetical protein
MECFECSICGCGGSDDFKFCEACEGRICESCVAKCEGCSGGGIVCDSSVICVECSVG